ncbi:MAG: hypothetical protein ABIQ02_10410 [Saprospiraceae bacterium]
MSEIQTKLKEKIQEAETIGKIHTHSSQLQTRLAEEEKALAIMEKALAKEQRDVELLEKEGLTTMFHKFLGDREERLQKERQDYLTAALRYNELYKSVELIRYELAILSKKEQNIAIVEKEIASLIKQREKELMNLDPETALQLKEIHEQQDKLHKYEVEVNQALSSGDHASELVRKTEYYLREGQLSDSDYKQGRRYHSSIVNYEAVDHARDMAYQAKQALIKFGNEFRDVYSDQPFQVSMEIEELGRFAEFFINNLITDWIIKQKISKSLTSVCNARSQLEQLIQQLEQEKVGISKKLEELEQLRKLTIVNSE